MHGYDCYDYGARHSYTALGCFTVVGETDMVRQDGGGLILYNRMTPSQKEFKI